jgi:hypothetical protein
MDEDSLTTTAPRNVAFRFPVIPSTSPGHTELDTTRAPTANALVPSQTMALWAEQGSR